MLRAVIGIRTKRLLIAIFSSALSASASLCSPFLIKLILKEIETPNRLVTKGIWLCFGLFASQVFSSILSTASYYHLARVAADVRSTLTMAVFQKAIRLSSGSRHHFSVGQLMSLASSDVDQIVQFIQLVQWTVSCPITTIFAFYLMIHEMSFRIAMFPIITFIVIIIINFIIANFMRHSKLDMVNATDDRVKLQTEVLHGIRTIKFNGWERALGRRLMDLRRHEIVFLTKFLSFQASNSVFMVVTPMILNIVLFAMLYKVAVEDEKFMHLISVSSVFALMACINLLRNPAVLLPISFKSLGDFFVAANRIKTLMRASEVPGLLNLTVASMHAGPVNSSTSNDVCPKPTNQVASTKFIPSLTGGLTVATSPYFNKITSSKSNENNNNINDDSITNNNANQQLRLLPVSNSSLHEAAGVEDLCISLRNAKVTLITAKISEQQKKSKKNQKNENKSKLDEGVDYSSSLLNKSAQDNLQIIPATTSKTSELNVDTDTITFLHNVTLDVYAGRLTAILGPTGSGKSALLASLAGELTLSVDPFDVNSSIARINGKIVYTPQEVWVLHATIKSNIIMDLPFDASKYFKALSWAQLHRDLRRLERSDKTVVGERGSSLSGGQKARVCFARSIYRALTVPGVRTVIFDDIFSAVDVRVGARMFKKGLTDGLVREGFAVVLALNSNFHLLQPDTNCMVLGVRKRPACVGPWSQIESDAFVVTLLKDPLSLKAHPQELDDFTNTYNSEEKEECHGTNVNSSFLSRASVIDERVSQIGSLLQKSRVNPFSESVTTNDIETKVRGRTSIMQQENQNNRQSELRILSRTVSTSRKTFLDDAVEGSSTIEENATSMFSSSLKADDFEDDSEDEDDNPENQEKSRLFLEDIAFEDNVDINQINIDSIKHKEIETDSLQDDDLIESSTSSKNKNNVVFSEVKPTRKSSLDINIHHNQAVNSLKPASTSPSKSVAADSLMLEEYRRRGKMGFGMLITYFSMALRSSMRSQLTGFLIVATIMIFYIFVFLARWAAELEVGVWAHGVETAFATSKTLKDLPEQDQSRIDLHFRWFIILIGAMIFFCIFVQVSIVKSVTKSSKRIFENALAGVLRASVPNFFDVTPVGRIANRLGKDIHVIDLTLTDSASDFFWVLAQCTTLIFTCVYAVPWFGLFIIPMLLVIYIVQSRYRLSSREVKRLDFMAHAPVNAALDEFLQGAPIVRTSGLMQFAETIVASRINESTRMYITSTSLQRWLNLRLDLLAAAATLTASFCVLFLFPEVGESKKDANGNPVQFDEESQNKLKLAGSCLVAVVQLATVLPWCTRFYCNTENSLISVERLLDLQEAPREVNVLPPTNDLDPYLVNNDNQENIGLNESEDVNYSLDLILDNKQRHTNLLVKPHKQKTVTFAGTLSAPTKDSWTPSAASSLNSSHQSDSRRKSKFLKRRSSIGAIRNSIFGDHSSQSLHKERRHTLIRMKNGNSTRLSPSWPVNGDIEFRRVSMRYRADIPGFALKDISFSIQGRASEANVDRGVTVGLCGRSGAGKSSILQALFRIVEIEKGGIYIDGVDTRSVGLDVLRSRISIIPQDPVLFSGSIRENLDPAYMIPTAVLWSALEEVQMAQIIRELFDFASVKDQADSIAKAKKLVEDMGKKHKLRTTNHSEKEIRKKMKKKTAIARRRSTIHALLDSDMLGGKKNAHKQTSLSHLPQLSQTAFDNKNEKIAVDNHSNISNCSISQGGNENKVEDEFPFSINELQEKRDELPDASSDINDNEEVFDPQSGFYDNNSSDGDGEHLFIENDSEWMEDDDLEEEAYDNGFSILPGDRNFEIPHTFNLSTLESGHYPDVFGGLNGVGMNSNLKPSRDGICASLNGVYPLIEGVDAREIWLSQSVSEQGRNLSAGQRQLLCVARALIKKSRILVLDEANSSMDPQSSELLNHAITHLLRGATVLTVAHRLPSVVGFDKIFIVDEGKIIEGGAPIELLKNKNSHFSLLAGELGPNGREMLINLAIDSSNR